MDEKDIIAKNITYYRKANGWSQLELAEKLQYSNKNISKWERGETVPSVFTLKRLSEIFGITLDELVTPYNETQFEKTVDENGLKDTAKKVQKVRNKMSYKHKLVFLFLAIAILYAVVFVAIFVMGISGVTKFNHWLLLLYATPLVALAVTIFIKCTLKRIDYLSLSLFGWLIAISVYVSLKNYRNMGYVFLLAMGYEFIVVCIGILVDYKYFHKMKQARAIRKQRKLLQKQSQQNSEKNN